MRGFTFVITIVIALLAFAEMSRDTVQTSAQPSDSIVLLGPSYPGLIEPSGKGRYQLHLRAALQDQGIAIEERILPVKRALLSFLDQGGDCIYSMVLPVREAGKNEKIVQSPPLAKAKLFIFQRKGNPPVVSVSSLPAKTPIGAVLGNEAYYAKSRRQGHVLDYVPEDRMNIEKLRFNRLSYIYGFFPNLAAYRNELSFDEKRPILEIPDSITCYDTPKTKKFIQVLNDRLHIIVESEFQKLKKEEVAQLRQIQIWEMKDLLTELLPPPLFIIENHLLSLQMLIEARKAKPDLKKLAEMKDSALQLKSGQPPSRDQAGFEIRTQYWKKRFVGFREAADTWTLFENGAMASAQSYLALQEKEYIPAIEAKNLALAEKILKEQLTPAYARHRNQIDSMVARVMLIEDRVKEQPEKILLLKDFLAEIFPPPLYLIEPFLALNRMYDMQDRSEALAMAHRALEGDEGDVFETTGYRTRMAFWKMQKGSSVQDEKEVWNQLEKIFDQGNQYFQIVNKKILPAASKNRIHKTEDVFRNEVMPLFERHQASVNELVQLLRKRISSLQHQAEARP